MLKRPTAQEWTQSDRELAKQIYIKVHPTDKKFY